MSSVATTNRVAPSVVSGRSSVAPGRASAGAHGDMMMMGACGGVGDVGSASASISAFGKVEATLVVHRTDENKIDTCCFHPVLPWVAIAPRRGFDISVFDHGDNFLVSESSLVDLLCAQHPLCASMQSELVKEQLQKGTSAVGEELIGRAVFLAFLDGDSLSWLRFQQQSIHRRQGGAGGGVKSPTQSAAWVGPASQGASTEPVASLARAGPATSRPGDAVEEDADAGGDGRNAGHCPLLFVGERCCVVFSVGSGLLLKALLSSQVRNRTFTTAFVVPVLSTSRPLVIIGCNDGTFVVWDPFRPYSLSSSTMGVLGGAASQVHTPNASAIRTAALLVFVPNPPAFFLREGGGGRNDGKGFPMRGAGRRGGSGAFDPASGGAQPTDGAIAQRVPAALDEVTVRRLAEGRSSFQGAYVSFVYGTSGGSLTRLHLRNCEENATVFTSKKVHSDILSVVVSPIAEGVRWQTKEANRTSASSASFALPDILDPQDSSAGRGGGIVAAADALVAADTHRAESSVFIYALGLEHLSMHAADDGHELRRIRLEKIPALPLPGTGGVANSNKPKPLERVTIGKGTNKVTGLVAGPSVLMLTTDGAAAASISYSLDVATADVWCNVHALHSMAVDLVRERDPDRGGAGGSVLDGSPGRSGSGSGNNNGGGLVGFGSAAVGGPPSGYCGPGVAVGRTDPVVCVVPLFPQCSGNSALLDKNAVGASIRVYRTVLHPLTNGHRVAWCTSGGLLIVNAPSIQLEPHPRLELMDARPTLCVAAPATAGPVPTAKTAAATATMGDCTVIVSGEPFIRLPVVSLHDTPPSELALDALAASGSGGGAVPAPLAGAVLASEARLPLLLASRLRATHEILLAALPRVAVDMPNRNHAIARLHPSPCRRLLAAVTASRELRLYDVSAGYAQVTVPTTGRVDALVWSSSSGAFAVMSADTRRITVVTIRHHHHHHHQGATTTSTGKNAAGGPAAQRAFTVAANTHDVTPADVPAGITGGRWLCVHFQRGQFSGLSSQFYRWDASVSGGAAVGGFLPQPLRLEWDPTATLCALVYPTTIVFMETRRRAFLLFASIDVDGSKIQDLRFHRKGLFAAMEDELWLFLPTRVMVHKVLVATTNLSMVACRATGVAPAATSEADVGAAFRGHSSTTSSASAAASSDVRVPLPPPVDDCTEYRVCHRPAGLLRIHGIVKDTNTGGTMLLLVGAVHAARLFVIPLSASAVQLLLFFHQYTSSKTVPADQAWVQRCLLGRFGRAAQRLNRTAFDEALLDFCAHVGCVMPPLTTNDEETATADPAHGDDGQQSAFSQRSRTATAALEGGLFDGGVDLVAAIESGIEAYTWTFAASSEHVAGQRALHDLFSSVSAEKQTAAVAANAATLVHVSLGGANVGPATKRRQDADRWVLVQNMCRTMLQKATTWAVGGWLTEDAVIRQCFATIHAHLLRLPPAGVATPLEEIRRACLVDVSYALFMLIPAV